MSKVIWDAALVYYIVLGSFYSVIFSLSVPFPLLHCALFRSVRVYYLECVVCVCDAGAQIKVTVQQRRLSTYSREIL